MIGVPSKLRLIRKAPASARARTTFPLSCCEKDARWKWNWPRSVKLNSEVYYESIKRESKIRGINKCRCDERLQTKTKEFTRLPYTGLVLELEHLKIETRLISERFANA